MCEGGHVMVEAQLQAWIHNNHPAHMLTTTCKFERGGAHKRK